MNTYLAIGISSVGGCLVGIIGTLTLAYIKVRRRGYKIGNNDKLYYYEAYDNGEEVDAIVSKNKVGDILAAIVEVIEPSDYPVLKLCRELHGDCVRIIFKASEDEHIKILDRAGIDYEIEEEE